MFIKQPRGCVSFLMSQLSTCSQKFLNTAFLPHGDVVVGTATVPPPHSRNSRRISRSYTRSYSGCGTGYVAALPTPSTSPLSCNSMLRYTVNIKHPNTICGTVWTLPNYTSVIMSNDSLPCGTGGGEQVTIFNLLSTAYENSTAHPVLHS